MNHREIKIQRLFSQQLVQPRYTSPVELVSYMVAMQAQDFPMAKWAVGVRIPGSTEKMVEAAITRAEILRLHVLRPTWHFVAAQDIYWMLDLTARWVMAGETAREKQLELTKDVFSRSNATLEKALAGGQSRTRNELIAALQQAGIRTDENRASHLFMRAELDEIICSGATQGGKATYALLSERVPLARRLIREAALAELARRYFTSRYPATQQDFSWWSGLPASEVKQALESVKQDFTTEVIDGVTYWLPRHVESVRATQVNPILLPTYDELLISYAERGASFPAGIEQHMKDISNRGIFWPILLKDGQVVGTWMRTLKGDRVIIELSPFQPLAKAELDQLQDAAQHYANFLDKKLELIR
ncbi:MAG: winged helix DNA-binding domain-containing protein [Anaerolineales bacterium]|nr:winged helix DNA-binding domain-containing protein [Anaerolineae bacterium]PWB51454.1 MAG: winged helix DNA-binding domain-containing protein [Anaerolineales bacterium]